MDGLNLQGLVCFMTILVSLVTIALTVVIFKNALIISPHAIILYCGCLFLIFVSPVLVDVFVTV